jgi:ribose transport system ATP-binding protein
VKDLSVKCRDATQLIGQLSGGNQQKVAIARLLEHPARIFLLDEPTRGIDVGSKAQIYRLIDALVADTASGRPRSVLIVSSYLPELLGMCDRIAVMKRGQLAEAAPAGSLTEHELLMAVTVGASGA